MKILIKKAWHGSTDEWHFVVGPRANNALIVTTIFRLMSPNVLKLTTPDPCFHLLSDIQKYKRLGFTTFEQLFSTTPNDPIIFQ